MTGAFLLLLVVLSSGWAQGQKAGETKADGGSGFGFNVSRSPIDISSDSVEGDQKQNKVTFKGNVVARQEGTTIYCNLLVITYDPEMKKLKEIVALGNVKIVNVEKRATTQEGDLPSGGKQGRAGWRYGHPQGTMIRQNRDLLC
jgi:lipopolysaccharide export system protein LptA